MENSIIEGCGALVYSQSTKRYLFLLRDQSKHSGSWGIVGGKLNNNETVIDGLHREINEEIGSIVYKKIVPIEKFTSDNNKFTYHTFLIVVQKEFVPQLNHEHKGYCWVHLKDYPRPLHPGVYRSFKFESIKNKIETLEQSLDLNLYQLQEQTY
jgi:8-oxo-dGTP pyrophosphatase MutT (NUDIX family)